MTTRIFAGTVDLPVRRSRRCVVAGLVLAALLPGSAARTEPPLLRSHNETEASFDCTRAATRVETVICRDSMLAQADGRLDFLYALTFRHAPPAERAAVTAGQRAWLRERDACADAKCLTERYEARETSLSGQLDRYDRLLRRGVARVGQCQGTTIEYIGGRLGNVPALGDHPDDTGTSVSFANGVKLVSYDRDRAVGMSRIGDTVRVCLVSIPRDCPPGDDRGREYRVTNLRTGGHWRMPDAEHECGGA